MAADRRGGALSQVPSPYAISKQAPSGWLGYRELLQLSMRMIFLAITEAAATFSTLMAFVRCTKKVRHKLGHASEIARHAGKSLFVLMGGARKKERLT